MEKRTFDLNTIQTPSDLKQLAKTDLKPLADKLRTRLIKGVAKTGGHLSSNLGTVELTIALLRCFDPPKDVVIWDVGHQSYAYKLLTGRLDAFHTLRQEAGISGFPKREESVYDAFNTGHSSTSISAALGILRAKKMRQESGYAIAIIGDGALTGGMAYEALNNIRQEDDRLIVILNDNQMSIDESVGAIARHFEHVRVQPTYLKLKQKLQKFFAHVPLIGRPINAALARIKSNFRRAVRPNHIIFESFGMRYYGPIEGHNIDDMTAYFEAAKQHDGPVLIHVVTQKGKGYLPAEALPSKYHGVAPFEIEQQDIQQAMQAVWDKPKITSPILACTSFSDAFSLSMVNLTDTRRNLIAITAAMASGTGLLPFKAQMPQYFYDVGIAEQHAVTMACGFAVEGIVPIVAIYSTFLQRAFDQIVHDCMLQKLHVVFAIDRAGVVGADGETHQGLYDRAWLCALPDVTIFEPRDYVMLDAMLQFAVDVCKGPVFIRYPRGASSCPEAYQYGKRNGLRQTQKDDLTKPSVLMQGTDLTIIACGNRVGEALKAAQTLRRDGLHAEVIDVRCIHPLAIEPILSSIKRTGAFIVIEEAVKTGSVGEKVEVALMKEALILPHRHLCLGDEPIPQASQASVYRAQQLDEDGCLRACLDIIQMKQKQSV